MNNNLTCTDTYSLIIEHQYDQKLHKLCTQWQNLNCTAPLIEAHEQKLFQKIEALNQKYKKAYADTNKALKEVEAYNKNTKNLNKDFQQRMENFSEQVTFVMEYIVQKYKEHSEETVELNIEDLRMENFSKQATFVMEYIAQKYKEHSEETVEFNIGDFLERLNDAAIKHLHKESDIEMNRLKDSKDAMISRLSEMQYQLESHQKEIHKYSAVIDETKKIEEVGNICSNIVDSEHSEL